MTWIKICGMTNLDDALLACKSGADAVGFVFYEASPRGVNAETAREICSKLPENVEKVGVFVNCSVDDWVQIVLAAKLTAVQHYMPVGSVTLHYMQATSRKVFPIPLKFYLALPLNPMIEAGKVEDQAQLIEGFALRSSEGELDAWFLDSGGAGAPGGTGKTFDWPRAAPLVRAISRCGQKAVVAGGLTPLNVGEAIETLRPWGVDVASGVETRPGRKDPEKLRSFVRAVREMDARIA